MSQRSSLVSRGGGVCLEFDHLIFHETLARNGRSYLFLLWME